MGLLYLLLSLNKRLPDTFALQEKYLHTLTCIAQVKDVKSSDSETKDKLGHLTRSALPDLHYGDQIYCNIENKNTGFILNAWTNFSREFFTSKERKAFI
jgi:hypothetical protein